MFNLKIISPIKDKGLKEDASISKPNNISEEIFKLERYSKKNLSI